VAVIAEITILSNQIQEVLHNLEAINNRNSQPQIRRIFAIIVVANVFFITRVILECTLAVALVQLMRGMSYQELSCAAGVFNLAV
jgi:predicted secreted protein